MLATGCTQLLDFDAVSKGGGTVGASGLPLDLPCDQRMPAPAFCDDFDHGAVGMQWIDFEKKNGTFGVDSLAAVSPADSLFSTASAITPADQVRAVLKTAFATQAGQPRQLTISFDVFVDAVDPKVGARVTAFALLYGNLSKYYQLVFNLTSTGSAASGILTENTFPEGVYKDHGSLAAPPRGAWKNVIIVITINNPSGSGNPLGLYFDGQRANSMTDELAAPLIGDNPRMELGIGWMDTTKGTGSWTVRYDNFAVYWDALP